MGNKKNTRNAYIVQGSILAIAGILVRILGIVKRIPLTNMIGDEGNGYYSAAYEVYNIILLISSYSLPLAVSKLVSARMSRGQYKNAERIFKAAMTFALIVGTVAFTIVFFFAEYLSRMMLEPMSCLALKLLSPSLLIVAVMGVYRGYFQGMGTMMPTAFSQVLEQIFLIIFSLSAAHFMFDYGARIGNLKNNASFAPAYGAAGGTLGCVMGAVFGLAFLLFVYIASSKNRRRQVLRDTSRNQEDYGQVFRVLILTIIPVILSTVVYNISNVIDQRIFNQVMISKGLEEVKTSLWGVYSGKYRVIINVPIALANAMCASVIPVLAGLRKEDVQYAREKVGTVIKFTMIIAIPSCIGLAVLAKPIMDMLFNGEIELAATLLRIGSISVIFFTLSTLGNGVLQGISKMKYPVINALIALVIHVGCLYIMLDRMNLGIEGVVYANIIFALVMCVLNHLCIARFLHYRQEFMKTFVIPFVCAGIMGIVIFIFHFVFGKVLPGSISTVLSICFGAITYFIMLFVTKEMNEYEWKSMPGGKFFVKAGKFLHLL